ncbi:MAG: twin-arginine translocase subunit TatC [Magnetococcales bacterium]|nr:twin-arginine translocase subunit TatC [Magnetococcales bacterium]NGZ27716.1 twin-arginine translocase subunit TatC [Magnetococcales bacterium]
MVATPDDKAPLIEHLVELRQRLLYSVLAILAGFLIAFTFAEDIFAILVKPLRDITGPQGKMIYTGLHEAFFTYIKVSFFTGLFGASPIILNQLWMFVAPGLYQHEKRAFFPFLVLTPALFFIGGLFCYSLVLPLAFQFFLSYVTESIEALPRLAEYLSLVISMMFAFGIAFEIPLLLVLLIRIGVISSQSLVQKRRYAIVGVFILAGILTPPDPYSQTLLAIPMLGMYELAIIGGRMIERSLAKKRQAEEEAEAKAQAEAAKEEEN